ncbi:MAG: M15 family metallopeptidase [Candidatus Paceibacterota bacterium]
MKKILWLTFIFTLLIVGRSFAAYNLTIEKPKEVTINATMTDALISDTYKLVLQTDAFPAGDTYSGKGPSAVTTIDPTIKRPTGASPLTTGTVTWSITGFKANTVYYARVVDFPAKGGDGKYITPTVSVKTAAASIPIDHLVTTLETSGSILVTGKINIDKVSSFSPGSFKAELYYTQTPQADGAKSLTDARGPLHSENSKGVEGINEDGTYQWRLNSLGPSAVYYIQQIVTLNGNSVNDAVGHFNSSTGNIISTTTDQASYNTQHSYTLLSGFPDLKVLPDPDLCAQQRATAAASGTAGPKFCDMNDVLNYALNLLIGLSAVMLVFRLMFEGYQYMMTDVPFLKASSKGAFFAALGGLLLAMTSYIILNTINPKLVSNNNIGPAQLAIGIQPDEDADPLINQGNISAPEGAAGICTAGITRVTVQKSSFLACRTIAPNLTRMLTAAYAQGIILEGGGFRTNAQQVALRKAHCNGDTTNSKAICKPPTAVPGHSNHESGLAFDFTCGNATDTISTHDNKCFIWLQNNASQPSYGLKNFSKEPWHWSVDGR